MKTFEIIAKTFKGLEEVLAKELIALGANDVELGRRMVSCKGDLAFLYKANLHVRTAIRFLVPIAHFKAKNTDQLYQQVKMIEWEKYLDTKTSFLIDSTIYSDDFINSQFASYRVKDAIADYFVEKTGKRPSVSISNPDLMINVHISQTHCTISLDSSGESLHKRGYKVSQTEAPINEVLAAGILLLAGWDGKSDFVDPMCGSGTFLVEAALIALNIPPGIFRKSFGFEKWKNFNKDLFDDLYNDDSSEQDFSFRIFGSDISPKAIKTAEENIKSAGLSKYVSLQVKPIHEFEKLNDDKALVVTNPPYGKRLNPDSLFKIYEDLGRILKFKFTGCNAWVISSDEKCLAHIGMKPSSKISLFNGDIDCLLFGYEIFEGKRKSFLEKTNKNRTT